MDELNLPSKEGNTKAKWWDLICTGSTEVVFASDTAFEIFLSVSFGDLDRLFPLRNISIVSET